MATGVRREAKIVTGIDDHSRFCVCAAVVERATSRAVCLAFAQALARFGVPEEVLTDNGKQFTDRFGGRGEVLFDRSGRRRWRPGHQLLARAMQERWGAAENL
ncbi:MAG TPA: DDE-type integrase/transposase/recombinase [Mycobacterium sp.]|nr:DDE-type integrase/transposase/recombinase [Mycobacterium sp.]